MPFVREYYGNYFIFNDEASAEVLAMCHKPEVAEKVAALLTADKALSELPAEKLSYPVKCNSVCPHYPSPFHFDYVH